MTKLITTFFFVGLAPFAPGTFGSLAALPVWLGLNLAGGWLLVLVASILLFFVGVWATGIETAGTVDHDPSRIVIDEVVGQWITLLPLSLGVAGTNNLNLWMNLALGFALFRLFDILKPWPVSWADDMSTPLGVMLDDVLAGVLAAISLIIVGYAVGWFSA